MNFMLMMSDHHLHHSPSSLCAQPINWGCRKSVPQLGYPSLQAFVQKLPQRLDSPIWPKLFKQAIQKSLVFDCAPCFAALCKKYCECAYSVDMDRADLKVTGPCEAADWSHFICTIFEENIRKGDAPERVKLDILLLLISTALKSKSWIALEHLLSVEIAKRDRILSFLWDRCAEFVVKMMMDECSWAALAPVVDQWLCDRGEEVVYLVKGVQFWLKGGLRSISVNPSRCVRWCADNGHAKLAFVVVLVTKQWDLVETVLTLPSLDIRRHVLIEVMVMLGKHDQCTDAECEDQGHSLCAEANRENRERSFSAGAAILKTLPVTNEMLGWTYFRRLVSNRDLGSACQRRGMWDWAIVIQNHNLAVLQQCSRFCENRTVLDWLLKDIVRQPVVNEEWSDLAVSLSKGCTDPSTLRDVLHWAFRLGHKSLAEGFMNHVDPTPYLLDKGKNSLLGTIVDSPYCLSARKTDMVRLLLGAGLAPFLRAATTEKRSLRNPTILRLKIPDVHTLTGAFLKDLPDIIDLTLACGVYSHKSLQAVASDSRTGSEAKGNQQLTECYERVQKAADTPFHLQQLARQAVSRSVGCRPGRAERIDSLPIPVPLKEMVRFDDVLHPMHGE